MSKTLSPFKDKVSSKIAVGDQVIATVIKWERQKYENVTGVVANVYERSAIIDISKSRKIDKNVKLEMNFKVNVSIDKLRKRNEN